MEVDYIEDEGWLIFVKGFVDDTHFEGPVSFKTSFHEMEGVKETAQVKGLIGNFRFTAFFSKSRKICTKASQAVSFMVGNSVRKRRVSGFP